MDRLDKIISSQSNFSRSDAKKLIQKRKVIVNGIVIKDIDYKVDIEKDIIQIDGKKLNTIKNIYLVLNKPKGYVSATKDNKDKTVLDLISDDFKFREIFPAGRLDKDTTGLMIITDDGSFSHDILSPKKHVQKVYEVTVDIKLTNEMVDGFTKGVMLNDGECKSAKLEIVDDYNAIVTIREGRYHQIKRMFGCYGAKVIELNRIMIGNFKLPKELKQGDYRVLTKEEIELIKERN